MKLCRVLLSGLLITSSFISSASSHGIYYTELEVLRNAPSTKQIFDEDAHSGLSKIHCDILTDKELSFFQRLIRGAFLGCDVVIVTSETMPVLYAYVDGICQKAEIVTPTIFVTRQDGFFNAFAQKLLVSTGGILIGQKLLHDLTDDAIEAVVAHEIGHIKHNHVNKMLALSVVDWIAYYVMLEAMSVKGQPSGSEVLFAWVASSFVSLLIINKRFEKEADEFACKDNGKAKGIVEMFELILKKDELREEEFVAVGELLQQNWSQLSFYDNTMLGLRYSLAKFGHNFTKAYKHIYHNTFLGAHPSPEARIAAAKEYLANHTA